ncbi:MAG: polyphenol oxidase [Rhodobacterales bacterium]|nr:MAG: polyphenol oxidase [Rhodobacterales bacterium]
MSLEILTDAALEGVQHGFFTRKGGASSGIYQGLNCGRASHDQRDAVETNRARAAAAMSVAPDHLITAEQVHSSAVLTLNAPLPQPLPEVDALVSNTPGLALAVLTADCQPVLLADRKAGVIGAAHAGWKGAAGGILENTVDAMERLGATRPNIVAIIGPCISQKHYEVGPEFAQNFLCENPDDARFFSTEFGPRPHFDLPGYGLHRLKRAGIGHASWTGHCTYADPERFYSFRRTTHQGETDYGRLIAAIRL